MRKSGQKNWSGGIDHNRVPLACAGHVGPLTSESAEGVVSSAQLVAPIAVHQNVACTLTHTGAGALGGALVGASQMAGTAKRVGDHSVERGSNGIQGRAPHSGQSENVPATPPVNSDDLRALPTRQRR